MDETSEITMTDIETLLSDFRKMAKSLKHFRVELIWCEPDAGEFIYTYSWCVLLGMFNIERDGDNKIYRQLNDFDYWKLCLNVSIEALFNTGTSASTAAFADELCQSCVDMREEAIKISEWLEKHPEISWTRFEDDEEGGEEDETRL